MAILSYLLSPKWSDAGVVTGSATVSNGDVSNVQNVRPRLRAVFTSGNCFIEGDFLVSRSINALCMAFINSIASTDTFQFRCKNTYPVTSSPVFDSTASTIWTPGSDLSSYAEIHRQYEFPTQNVRYWRVDFSCSQPVQIGRLFPGLRLEPASDVSSWVTRANEPIAATVDLGGEETRRPMGGARRSIHLEWPDLTKDEAFKKIYEMMLERGSAKDYMVSLLPGGGDIISPMVYIYIGCGAMETNRNSFTHVNSASVDVIEMAAIRML